MPHVDFMKGNLFANSPKLNELFSFLDFFVSDSEKPLWSRLRLILSITTFKPIQSEKYEFIVWNVQLHPHKLLTSNFSFKVN